MIHLQFKLLVYFGPVWLNISPELTTDTGATDGHGHSPEHDIVVAEK